MRRINKSVILIISVLLCLSLLTACGNSTTSDNTEGQYKIAVVPKLTSAGWFQRMESCIDIYNEEHNTNYYYGGPTDGSDQAAYLEQLLAEDWDAICIVPYDSESISPLLERARRDGILIITHEADTMDHKYVDYDLEPFVATDLGAHFGESIVNATGGTGTYIQFVGSLNAVTHRQWCQGAEDYISANSTMTKLGIYESNEDKVSAYNQTKELLQAHPEITAIEGSASTDIAGVAQAVMEMGLTDKVYITGLSLPSVSADYIKSGTIETFSLWDPGMAAIAMLRLAETILNEGDDFDPYNCSLDVPGYEKLDYINGAFYGHARTDITIDNVTELNF